MAKNLLALGPKLNEDEKVFLTSLYKSALGGVWYGGRIKDHPCHKFDPNALLMPLDEALERSAFWLEIGAVYPGEETLKQKLEELYEQRYGSNTPAQTKKRRTPRSKRRPQSSP